MIWDTGPLVAAANVRDPDHEPCAELLDEQDSVLVPAPVIAEACFLIAKAMGPSVEAAFLRSLSTARFELLVPSRAEMLRAATLVQRYGDLPLGGTDAIVMAIAEARASCRVATLDRRHFSVVVPEFHEHFQIRP